MPLDAVFAAQFNESTPQMLEIWHTLSMHNEGALVWHYIFAANLSTSFTLQVCWANFTSVFNVVQ